jgi:hypothetical protein
MFLPSAVIAPFIKVPAGASIVPSVLSQPTPALSIDVKARDQLYRWHGAALHCMERHGQQNGANLNHDGDRNLGIASDTTATWNSNNQPDQGIEAWGVIMVNSNEIATINQTRASKHGARSW